MNALYNNKTNEQLDISNSGLRVLSDILALAMSDGAKSDQQRDFAIELLHSMDQFIVGTGGAYIDVRMLPWGDDFRVQQEFLLAAIDKAHEQHRWMDLPYGPSPERAQSNLQDLRKIITNLQESDSSPEPYERVERYRLCPTHNVLEHVYGCVICHNNE